MSMMMETNPKSKCPASFEDAAHQCILKLLRAKKKKKLLCASKLEAYG
jgi:hypothetical protein